MTDSLSLSTFLKPYECSLLIEETSEQQLRELDAELPSDTFLVRYSKNGEHFTSAFRAYKMVDIFDPLCDAGYQVHEIRLGFGRIKPKLYQGQ